MIVEYYYNRHSRPGQGLIAYLRLPEIQEETSVLVLINFSEQGGTLRIPFTAGRWQEQLALENQEVIEVNSNGDYEVYVPSNYGKIFICTE